MGLLMAYEMHLSELANSTYEGITSKSDAKKLTERLDAVQLYPGVGRIYDPEYDASFPPHELQVTYAGNYGIYYVVDESRQLVEVEFIEDQRHDPTQRFQAE